MRPPMKKQPGRRARRPAREPAANLESVNLEGALICYSDAQSDELYNVIVGGLTRITKSTWTDSSYSELSLYRLENCVV